MNHIIKKIKNWYKNIIIILLIINLVPLATGMYIHTDIKKSDNPIFSQTLYVGGTGPNNYTKIQDAIDNASNQDTIFVYNGIYQEHIIINKEINPYW
jgi:pectin methylesterase-like acyl-CoA thioesterase